MRYIFLSFIFIAFNSIFAQQQRQVIILSYGPMDGLYHQVALGIQEVIHSQTEQLEVIVVPSAGSVENIERLKNGLTDWAIIQRDIAVDAYYHKTLPFHDFEVILPLFEELVQIYLHPDPRQDSIRLLSLQKFASRILNGTIQSFAIGPPNSGTNNTLKHLLSLYGISKSHPAFLEIPMDSAIQKFTRHEIQAIGLVSGTVLLHTPNFLQATAPFHPRLPITIITLETPDFVRISSHIPNLDRKTQYINLPPRIFHTVRTWAFLVTRKETNRIFETHPLKNLSIVQLLLNHIYQTPGVPENLAPLITTFGENGLFKIVYHNNTFRLMSQTRSNQSPFRGLPLHSDLRLALQINDYSIYYIGLGLIILVILIFVIMRIQPRLISQKHPNRWVVYLYIPASFWQQHKRTIWAAGLALIMILPLTFLLKYFENQFYHHNLIRSPFQDLSIFEIIRWLFVFSLTGFEQGIFPKSIGAQYIIIITSFLGWAAIVLAVFFEVVSIQRKRLRRQGMIKSHLKNHIVICGSNDRLPNMLIKAISAEKKFLAKKHRRKYLVLDNRFSEYVEKYDDIRKMIDSGELEFIAGDPKNMEALASARVDKANAVILLAEDRSQEADERTLLRALAISRYCRQFNGQDMLDSIYIIAEINDPQFEEDLLQSDVNEVVCSSEMIEDVILQSSLNHGISEILNELLKFNEYNEFYFIDIEEYPFLEGKTFDELLVLLRRANILLLGIKVIFKNEKGEIIDHNYITKHLNKMNLKRHIIVNPLDDYERNYRTRQEDHLIVLAKTEKEIVKQLKRLGDMIE